MKNAVVFLATGFEEIEALGTIDVLRRGGVRVMMVSITGDRLVIGAHDIPVMADYLFEEADFSCVDALILPGGIPGSNHLNAHAHLKELVLLQLQMSRVLVEHQCLQMFLTYCPYHQ